jgi:hypothetical protein
MGFEMTSSEVRHFADALVHLVADLLFVTPSQVNSSQPPRALPRGGLFGSSKTTGFSGF